MRKEDKCKASLENNAPFLEAGKKKARIVSSIREKAEQDDKEENKGRS